VAGMTEGPLVHDKLAVRGRVFGSDQGTLFVVEEGQANSGDYETALKMIRLAGETGADAIEFQLAIADDFYVRAHPNHAVYRAREFSQTQLVGLRESAEQSGLIISASPLSDRLVSRLTDAGYPLFTVNSSDIDNGRMLDAVADSGVPFMIGTAMARIEEIDWAVERLLRRGAGSFALLHGQHIMTTGDDRGVPENETSLTTIGFLHDRYRLPVGFIDHTSNKVVPALAVSHGAAIITKHLAPQPGWRGADWQVCLPPAEMAECVELVRLANRVKGSWGKYLASGELADRTQMRRSIVASRDLPANTILRQEDLMLKRPGTGLDSVGLDSIVGRTLTVAVRADDQISLEHLA
jgi:sialic acid synthase SpsE